LKFEITKNMKKKIPQLRVRVLSLMGVAALVAIVLMLTSRPGKAVSDAVAAPSVAVVKVTREDLAREIKIPAEFRPYSEVELHAKVSGYLQQITVDFGDRVKAGQLLATIEIPE